MAKWLNNPEQLLFEVRYKVAYTARIRPEIGPRLMTAAAMQRISAENDGRVHMPLADTEFFDNAKALSFKKAQRLRDALYANRTGDARVDSVVKLNIRGANPQI